MAKQLGSSLCDVLAWGVLTAVSLDAAAVRGDQPPHVKVTPIAEEDGGEPEPERAPPPPPPAVPAPVPVPVEPVPPPASPPPMAAAPVTPPESSSLPPGASSPVPPPAAESAPLAAASAHTGEDDLGFGPEPSTTGPAADGDDLGFGDGSGGSNERAAPAPPSEPSPWSLQGALREFSAVRTEQEVVTRLASLRFLLDLKLGYNHDFMLLGSPSSVRLVAAGRGEFDFAMLNKVYDKATRETYTWQAIPQDIYVALNTGPFELSFGKQIVPFGQGEVLTSLDVVNPRDLREPVMTDPSDLRLAMLMSRIGLRMGAVHLEGIVVHESNPGLIAPPLGEWSPTRKLLLEGGSLRDTLATRDLRYDHRPDAALWRTQGMQYHARLTYLGSGYELTFQAASLLDAFGVTSLPTAEDLMHQEIYLDLFHPRYTLLGHSGTFNAGEFVFRWEASADLDRLTATRRVDTNLLRLESRRFTQLHAMVGLSWIPNTQTSATVEWLQSYVLNDPMRNPPTDGSAQTALLWPIEAPQFAFRLTHTFADERASINVLMLLIGIHPFNAFAGKFEAAYKLTDSFLVTLGYMAYHGSIQFGPLYGFGKNDRVLFGLRWDFTVH